MFAFDLECIYLVSDRGKLRIPVEYLAANTMYYLMDQSQEQLSNYRECHANRINYGMRIYKMAIHFLSSSNHK